MGKAIKSVASVASGGLVGGSPISGAKNLFAMNPITKALGIGADGEQGEYANTGSLQDFYANTDREMANADRGVQTSGLTKDLYGEGGLQSQLAKEQSQLANQGYQLTQDDHTAYGQAAGDIARQFGQQENDIASSLARRGLAGADSGAAIQSYAGAAGNRNEQLAKAQTDIAQKRYQDTTQRLQNVRNQMQSLGAQGSQLAQQRYNTKENAASGGVAAKQQELNNKQAAYKPGLLESLGAGLQSGVTQLATKAPGMAMGKTGVPGGSGGWG